MDYRYETYYAGRKRFTVDGIGVEIIDGIPLDVFRDRPRTLSDVFDASVRRDPRKEAVVLGETRISYGELAETVFNLGHVWRQEYGVGKGDRIMLLLRNTPEFVISFLTAAQIGAVSVPTNTRLKGPEIEYIWNDCRPKLVVVEPELWGRIREIKTRPESLQAFFVTGPENFSGAARLSEAMSCARARPAPRRIAEPATEEDVNSIIYTSGTTGVPKGAMLCHRNFIANSLNCQSLCRLSPADKLLIMAPMFHVTALNSQLVKTLHAGATAVLLRAFKTEDVLDTIERERITEMTGVPAMYQMMLQSPTIERRDLSTLRYSGYGGAPAPVELIKTLKNKYPTWRLRNVYGLTECSSWGTLLPHEQTTIRPDSVGLPLPVVKVRVVDPGGCDLPAGEVGEILMQGPNIFKGYWEKPEATAETLRQGWLHTGDLGRFDEEGYLYVVDRKKEMVIRGGENVYCIEVENVLYQHPKVVEAAVTGAPDAVFGEVVKAVIALKPGMRATPEEIQEFCKPFLADFKIPRHVKFVDALPRNAAGKVLKKEL